MFMEKAQIRTAATPGCSSQLAVFGKTGANCQGCRSAGCREGRVPVLSVLCDRSIQHNWCGGGVVRAMLVLVVLCCAALRCAMLAGSCSNPQSGYSPAAGATCCSFNSRRQHRAFSWKLRFGEVQKARTIYGRRAEESCPQPPTPQMRGSRWLTVAWHPHPTGLPNHLPNHWIGLSCERHRK